MSRSRHSRPSRLVRKEDINKKKNSQVKKTAKPANKNVILVKTASPGKLKQLIQERDGKKKTEAKPPMPTRSLLTRAGAARMNLDRTEVLFQNPESLTCNGFTMALRSTSLSRRLSQPPVVTAKPKKVPPSKSSGRQRECECKVLTNTGVKHSENDPVPNPAPPAPLDTENLIGVQNVSLVKGESPETTQAWSQTVEESKIHFPTPNAPPGEILSGPPERSHCGERLLSEWIPNDTPESPSMFAQDTLCAPLSQRAATEVTSHRNPNVQLEDLGSRVQSLKLIDSSLDPVQSEQNSCPPSAFNQGAFEQDLRSCLSIYPSALIKFLLAGSEPQTFGAQPHPQEALKATPVQEGAPDPTSVLGLAFRDIPHQWEFLGANPVPGVAPGPPQIPGATSVQREVFGAILNQQESLSTGACAAPDLAAFLPLIPNAIAVYNALPKWSEPGSAVANGFEVQDAVPILPLGLGHAPQPSSGSELSSAPLVIAASNAETKEQVHVGLQAATTSSVTVAPARGLLHAPPGAVQLSQTGSGAMENQSPQVSVSSSADVSPTGVSMPVSLASAATSSSYTTLLPTLEKKKRKRCGVCGPCQQKTNCGECTYCKNRKNSHQICKKRKCEELKKKPSVLVPLEVIKENKRPQREKKPKVLKADFENKPVNGLKSESMEYSSGGHGEEQRLEINTQTLENVTKNESMTGIEVERWMQNKKSHLFEHVNGDFSADVTKAEKSKQPEEDKKPNKPPKLFAQTLRNGIKNVPCLAAEANTPFNKFSIEEFGKALGNHPYKLLKDTANHNNAMSSTGTSCDHLKDKSNIFIFQKPGFNCKSEDSPNLNSQTSTHSEGDQPKTPENRVSKDPRDCSPMQPTLLSLMKDRRLTLEQVVAIEALTQLSEAPSENSSPSKSEKEDETAQRTASLLNSCKAILNSVRKDLQDPNFHGEPQSLPHRSSLEKQSSRLTAVFNGQNTLSKPQIGSATNQAPTKPLEHSKVKNSISFLIPKANSSNTNKSVSGSRTGLDDLHQLPPTSKKLGYCNQLLNRSENLNSKEDSSSQDTSYSQIEEDVATQLTQLASIIKCNYIKAEDKNAESPPTSLVAHNANQKHSQEKGTVPQKPPSSVQNNHSSSLGKQKNTTQKKAKSTPKRDRRKKKPTVVTCQENDQKQQEHMSYEYSKLHDIWIGSKFQRFGQFGPHDFPLLLGKIPPISKVLKPLAQASTTLQHKKLFPPLSQIKFERYSELAQEKMVKVEPLDSLPVFYPEAKSHQQVCADKAHSPQVQATVNGNLKAYPLPPPSRPPNQCTNLVASSDQTRFPQDAREHLRPQRLAAPTAVSPETPLPDPAQILRNLNVVSSGGITVVSPKSEEEVCSPGVGTSEFSPVDNAQKNFHDYAMKFLTNPAKNLVAATKDAEVPACNCPDRGIQKDKGPYYTHLGAGPSVAAVREIMENRYGQKGKAIRIEKVVYTGKEGKSSQGCPVAKWVIRRSSEEEKVLCLVRQRPGHQCETAVIVVLIMLWDGIPLPMADRLYTELTENLKSYSGHPTDRRCTLNENRTCTCQGIDPERCGASFSFGCSWSMYFNGCKFGRSPSPRRFRIDPSSPLHEKNLEDNLQNLATELAPIYKQYAPVAYQNQVEYEHVARECRLGRKEGRPFSGVTACLDFCAHPHRDIHNMNNGSTVVCTLTREDNRSLGVIPEDEQLHVLPLYRLSDTDEFGSKEGMEAKIQSGAVQVLQPTRRKRMRFTQPVPRSGKKRAAMMTEVLERKIRAVEKKQSPRVKRKNNSAMANNSKATSLPIPGSDNTKCYSSVPSMPHPVKEANLSPVFCPLKPPPLTATPVRYPKIGSLAFPGRSSTDPCTTPPAAPAGAHVAAGESAAAPVPTLSPPMREPLAYPEPPPGPAEHPGQQPLFLASCLADEEEQHWEGDEPLSDDALSDELLFPAEEKLPYLDEYWSDSEHIFLDASVGGVAIAPTHGSVLIECARRELHATTPVANPNRNHPTRLSLVFYQHKNLNKPQHGFELNKIKFEAKEAKNKKTKASEQKEQAADEGTALFLEVNELNQIPSHKALTLTHDNIVTVSPYALTHVAGPYNHWV
ncbi:methylcytosine dioxygenase TET1 isoform X2 [Heterocephalus glaber]|uniref:Methylcytosine dioxygenase TET n=1 Tax=Heterocephalus glaber TaxID=10181 RepID=A0AAX6SYV4_HETGA|nr:methylcytosine dioxygenase TET1 isoform X2 [Heterocephalus glaber]